MATIDKTRIPNNPIKETSNGSLVAKNGISREVVIEMSKIKNEPQFMLDMRLKSLDIFERKPVPTWGVDLSGLDLDELVLYKDARHRQVRQLGRRPRRAEGNLREARHPAGRARVPRRRRRSLGQQHVLRGPQGAVQGPRNHLLPDGHRRPGATRSSSSSTS